LGFWRGRGGESLTLFENIFGGERKMILMNNIFFVFRLLLQRKRILKLIQSPPKTSKVLLQCIFEFLHVGGWGLR